MADGTQTIDSIGVALTLDTSHFDQRLAARRTALAEFTRAQTATLRTPQTMAIAPQFKVTQAQVRGLRTDINQHMTAMAARNEAVAVPVKLGASDWAGMRAEIAQKIGTVPISVTVAGSQPGLRAGGRGAMAHTADPLQVLAAWIATTQGLSLPNAQQSLIRAARSKGITGRAKGGKVTQSRPYLVGEDEPEVVEFDRPATVIPVSKYQRPMPHYPGDAAHVSWCPQCRARLSQRAIGGRAARPSYGGKYGSAKGQYKTGDMTAFPGREWPLEETAKTGYLYHGTFDIDPIRGMNSRGSRGRDDSPGPGVQPTSENRHIPGAGRGSSTWGFTSYWALHSGDTSDYGNAVLRTRKTPRFAGPYSYDLNEPGVIATKPRGTTFDDAYGPGIPYEMISGERAIGRRSLQYYGSDDRWHGFRRGRKRAIGGWAARRAALDDLPDPRSLFQTQEAYEDELKPPPEGMMRILRGGREHMPLDREPLILHKSRHGVYGPGIYAGLDTEEGRNIAFQYARSSQWRTSRSSHQTGQVQTGLVPADKMAFLGGEHLPGRNRQEQYIRWLKLRGARKGLDTWEQEAIDNALQDLGGAQFSNSLSFFNDDMHDKFERWMAKQGFGGAIFDFQKWDAIRRPQSTTALVWDPRIITPEVFNLKARRWGGMAWRGKRVRGYGGKYGEWKPRQLFPADRNAWDSLEHEPGYAYHATDQMKEKGFYPVGKNALEKYGDRDRIALRGYGDVRGGGPLGSGVIPMTSNWPGQQHRIAEGWGDSWRVGGTPEMPENLAGFKDWRGPSSEYVSFWGSKPQGSEGYGRFLLRTPRSKDFSQPFGYMGAIGWDGPGSELREPSGMLITDKVKGLRDLQYLSYDGWKKFRRGRARAGGGITAEMRQAEAKLIGDRTYDTYSRVLDWYRTAQPERAQRSINWYPNANHQLARIARTVGLPLDQVAAIVAEISSNNPWPNNALDVMRLFPDAWRRDPSKKLSGPMATQKNRANIWEILKDRSGAAIAAGIKKSHFTRALMGDPTGMPADVWMARLSRVELPSEADDLSGAFTESLKALHGPEPKGGAGWTQGIRVEETRQIHAAIQRIAEETGLEQRSIQSALWDAIRDRSHDLGYHKIQKLRREAGGPAKKFDHRAFQREQLLDWHRTKGWNGDRYSTGYAPDMEDFTTQPPRLARDFVGQPINPYRAAGYHESGPPIVAVPGMQSQKVLTDVTRQIALARFMRDIKPHAAGGDAGRETYLVGELNPELFVPDRLRYIIPPDVFDKLPKRAEGGQTRKLGAGVMEVGTRGPHLFQPPEDGWIIPHTLTGRVSPHIPRAAGGARQRRASGAVRYAPTPTESAAFMENILEGVALQKAEVSGLVQSLSGRTPASAIAGASSTFLGGRGEAIQRQSLAKIQEREYLRWVGENSKQIQTAANLKANENNLTARQTARLRKLEPILDEFGQRTQALSKTFSDIPPDLAAIGRNFVSVLGANAVYGVAMQGVSAVIAAATPQVQRWVDSVTDFTATNQRITKDIGGQLRQQGGNAEAVFGQIALQTGLSSQAQGFLQQSLFGASVAKGGAQAQAEKSDLFRAAAAGRAPTGLVGGYGGLFGSAILGEFLGGGKGLAEQLGLDIKDLAQKAVVPKGNGSLGANGFTAGLDQTLPFVQQANERTAEQAKLASKAGDALRVYETDISDSLKYGAQSLGQAAYAFKDVSPEDLKKFSAISLEAKDMAANGKALVDSTGKVVETMDEFNKALTQLAQGDLIGRPEAYAATQARQLQTGRQVSTASMRFGTTTALGMLGLEEAANPTISAAAGIIPTRGSTGLQGRSLTTVTDSLQRSAELEVQIKREYNGYLDGLKNQIATWTPELSKEFNGLVDEVSAIGDRIGKLQVSAANAQANASAVSFANNLRLATRALKDAQNLAGGNVAGGRLGTIQREQFLAQREAQAISLEIERRQIAFSIAQAGFTAPGITGEERQGRIDEAKKEAQLRQRQLGISERLYGLGGQEFTESVARAVQDAKASLGVIQANRAAELEIAATNAEIARQAKIMAPRQARIQQIINKAQTDFGADLSSAAGYVAMFGGTVAAATKAIQTALGINTGAGNKGGTQTKKPQAAGGVFAVSAPTSFVAGDAGGEHVVVLRNPREGTIAATSNAGTSGSINVYLSIGNIGSKDDYPELERRITRSVKAALGQEATLLGLRAGG